MDVTGKFYVLSQPKQHEKAACGIFCCEIKVCLPSNSHPFSKYTLCLFSAFSTIVTSSWQESSRPAFTLLDFNILSAWTNIHIQLECFFFLIFTDVSKSFGNTSTLGLFDERPPPLKSASVMLSNLTSFSNQSSNECFCF